jgi:hypothetical protein
LQLLFGALAHQAGAGLEAGQTVPREVDEVRRDVGLLRFASVEPPLTGLRVHAYLHLLVLGGVVLIEPPFLVLVVLVVLELGGGVTDE